MNHDERHDMMEGREVYETPQAHTTTHIGPVFGFTGRKELQQAPLVQKNGPGHRFLSCVRLGV